LRNALYKFKTYLLTYLLTYAALLGYSCQVHAIRQNDPGVPNLA